MSSILYYSSHCPNSSKLLGKLSKSSVQDDIHFVSVDRRERQPDGATNVVLENGQKLLLPPSVTKVPALLLLNQGNQVLFGAEIDDYLKPKQVVLDSQATGGNGEPLAFSLDSDSTQGFGVASDSFSFLDQSAEDLSAKGGGGMRQQWHYATIGHADSIETPPDTYAPDKVGSDTYKSFEAKRSNEIPKRPSAPVTT